MKKLLLIPYPKKVEFSDGDLDCRRFRLSGEPCFAADDFIAYAVGVGEKDSDGVEISYEKSDALSLGRESYTLKISEAGIKIFAGDDSGIRYAFCTLRQLYHNYAGILPRCIITDEPYLKYRGFLLDNGRYFFPVEVVKKFIDCCYMHKLNVLHWHLTEDQGWRMETDKYPLLTKKGSRRSHTNFGCKPHGGYYTKSDIREIIAYANERGIEVIPEIDMPGHIQSALACYPYLGCFDRKLPVATHWGVKHDVLCVGKESTFTFVFDILEEVIELFGKNTKYIHIGADEVDTRRWKLCKHCQALIKRENLAGENDLQAYFMRRVSNWLQERNFTPIAWNGVRSEAFISDRLIWQCWSNKHSDDGVQSKIHINGGFINSSNKSAYIDLPYGRISLKDCYNFSPLPEDLSIDELVGAEMTLWTEYIPDFKTGCKKMLPRSCALAEAMWLNSDKNDYDGFLKRLKPMLNYLSAQGYKSAPMKVADPNKIRGLAQIVWFERRQLHWQGLHNLIDDAHVARKYSPKKDSNKT